MGQIGLSLAAAFALLSLARPFVMALLSSDAVVGALLGAVYRVPVEATPEHGGAASYSLDSTRPTGTVDARFLSLAVDSSQVAGGHWWSADGRVELPVGSTRVAPFDFDRPGLLHLTRALSPAYLRVGGTEADNIHYAIEERAGAALKDGYDLVLERAQWDSLQGFVERAGLSLMFTVNAGPGPRDGGGVWRSDDLEPLLAYSAARGYDVPVWELGNEPNAYWLTQGLSAWVGGRQYAADVARFSRAVRRHYPDARIAGGAVFVWPVLGEPPPRLLGSFLQHSQVLPDIVTWHYYPQQSRRCWSATRRASPTRMLEPRHLDEFGVHAATFSHLAQRPAAAAQRRPEVWVGETGGAQCGGEPGVSDRFASSLWWLDQLGLAARGGQQVVVRQTLVGSDYGLLDADSLRPRPDYWASLLWKRLMGTRVLALENARANPHLRVYAHCHPGGPGGPGGQGRATVLAINLASQHAIRLSLPELGGSEGVLYRIEADSLTAETVTLNGAPLRLQADGTLPALVGEPLPGTDTLALDPLSYAFATIAGVPACH